MLRSKCKEMREGFGGGGLHGGDKALANKRKIISVGFLLQVFITSCIWLLTLCIWPRKLVNWHHALVEFLNFIIS